MTDTKKHVDWEAVEIQFRAGMRSLEDIGKEYGITKGRISQVAKAKGWTRDLRDKIRAKADAKVARQAAQEVLNAEALNDPAKQATRRLAESEVVDANADIMVVVQMAHRSDMGRTRKMFGKLMDELELTTDNKALFEQLGALLDTSGENADGKFIKDAANAIYQKVISMQGRVDSAKKLTEMLEKVVAMERKAFGIDDADQGLSELDALYKKINSEQ